MGQFTDGVFQSALASFVLFSPERQPDAKSAAAAFAVVLLPYSLIGPFVGTILDRVSRQRVILFANLFRALTLIFIAGLVRNGATGIELTIFVLLAFGVNRLILAGLSAGLPLLINLDGVEGRNNLVSVNATAVTGGTVFVVIGGGVGIGIRTLRRRGERQSSRCQLNNFRFTLFSHRITSLSSSKEGAVRPHGP
jgi:MFS family permease